MNFYKPQWSLFVIGLVGFFSTETAVGNHGPDKFWERMSIYSEIDKTGELGPFSVNVKSFGSRSSLEPKNISSNDRYDQYFKDEYNIAALVTKNGKIIYERYNAQKNIDQNSQLFGASFAKTATSSVIGGLFCEGKIKDLDAPASDYSEFLAATEFADITIRNLLQMNSGVSAGRSVDEKRITRQARGIRRFEGRGDVRKALKRFSDKETEQGERFEYHAADTLALAVLAEDITGEILSKTFYDSHFVKFSPNGHMHWLSDQKGTPAAFADLVMSARDWSAFGNYLMGHLRAGSCLGKFFQNGVDNAVETPRDGVGYGFQSWVYMIENKPTLVMRGHGGQFNVILPEKNTVVTIFSIDENYSFGNLFKKITELVEKVL